MRVRGSFSPPHSHAWLLDMFPMHYARRRCAIGPRRIAVFIDVVFVRFLNNYTSWIKGISNHAYPMKTAVRLGPIAHLRRAQFEVVAYGNQAWEWGGDKLPLTLIPGYLISPLTGWGWRMKHWWFYKKSCRKKYGFWTPFPSGWLAHENLNRM